MNLLRTLFGLTLALTLGVSFATGDGDTNTNPQDRIELIGVAEIPGTAIDKSGLSQELDADSTNNMLGGFSGTAYSGKDDLYYFLSDRGPKDGAVDWSCRVQSFRVTTNLEQEPSISVQLVETNLLRDARGIPFTGLASCYERSAQKTGRLDPEGIRVAPSGNLLISDEYGPRLIEFNSSGKLVREFSVPQKLLIENPGLSKADENPKNVVGRQCNRGMEGLAISLDHQTLYGLMQSPLLQDSYRENITDKPSGLNCRLEQLSIDGKSEKEYLYHLDDNSNKLNEILACSETSFVVIERDGEAGDDAVFKKLMLISLANATDISSIDKLPPTEIPKDVRAVKKKVLIDLLNPEWNLAGEKMPEKIEGLAFGPDLADGRKLLLVSSDNDFERKNASYIYAFAIPRKALEFDQWVTVRDQ